VQEEKEEAGILPEYKELKEVFFFASKAQAVAEHGLHNLRIYLMEGKEPPLGATYYLSAKELETLRDYFYKNLT
jgi:hypothetical protein